MATSTGKSVHKIAQELQQAAQSQLGIGSNLKGNISNAEFKNKVSGSELNNDICNLKKETHTNDKRTYSANPGYDPNKHQGPCTGKGGGTGTNTRFVIGTQWEPKDKEVNEKYKDVLLSLRRRHMCTSNLENLETNSGPLSDVTKVNDSFLGDVLLAAKYEGEYIKNKLGNDHSSICTAMKYSFADLGDIIRGTDIWEKNEEQARLQNNLKEIFKKIKDKVKDNNKYNNDNDKTTPPFKQLREDWWEANRSEIWKAMTCEAPQQATLFKYRSGGRTNFSSAKCGPSDPPPDDYIPQLFRWLTEWSESYCKQLKADYNSVKEKCNVCKNHTTNRQCKKGQPTCTQCIGNCNVYTENVKKWKSDWDKQKQKYNELYNKTTTNTTDNDPIKEKLKEFLPKLKGKGGTSSENYKNSEDFIDSLGGYRYCVDAQQNKYKESEQSDPAHIFQETPKDYQKACSCDKTTPCDTVETLLEGQDGKSAIDGCNLKYDSTKSNPPPYPGWKCDTDTIDSTHDGACMSGRRQKLCVHYLKELTNCGEKELKEAFIKTASAETFVHWQYYKDNGDGKGRDVDTELKNKGTIPPDFLRSMMYTFGDLRDLCLDEDISTKDAGKNDHVKTARHNITTALKNGSKDPDKTKRTNWWKQNAPDIWQGMVCGLSHHISKDDETERQTLTNKQDYQYGSVKFGDSTTTSGTPLSKFVERPQFLRWMTEWGEDFCRKQKEEYHKVKDACTTCNVVNDSSSGGTETCKDENKCKQCKEQCKLYEKFIQEWKGYYTKQKDKFKTDKVKSEYTSADNDVKTSKDARDYLSKKLKNMKCTNKTGDNTGKCDCMEQKSSPTSDMPKSLDEYPSDDYRKKCTCTPPPPQKPAIPKPPCTGNKILDAANTKLYEAQKQLQDRGGNKLKGKIENATFKNNKTGKYLGGNICEITMEYTNDFRQYDPSSNNEPEKHKGPCTGKGEDIKDRFVIGKPWATKDGEVDENHKEVLFPPRRLDMCTSNLENLARKNEFPEFINNTNVNDSFLGDMLVTAKYEGQDIVHKHLSKGDKSGICNAMKYSFADLGDIIRGRDIWTGEQGNENLQKHLTAIFKKIKDQNGDGKYDSDTDLTRLRSDWWTANRDQIWKAMTCEAPAGADLYIPSTSDGTKTWEGPKCGGAKIPLYVPPDDYIPQRLRWMTEWAESYCKQLERNYWWLMFNCKACQRAGTKSKGKDTESKTTACTFCSSMCRVYKDHVTGWKKQWEYQKTQYNQLNSGGTPTSDEIKKQHEEFLQKVKDKNSSTHCTGANTDKNDYDNLSDYVTSMGGSIYCNDTSQKKFEEDTSGGGSKDSVFQEHPKDYINECKDKQTNPPKKPDTTTPGGTDPPQGPEPPGRSEPGEPQTPPKSAPTPKEATATTPQQKDACEIVGTINWNMNGRTPIEECNHKYNPNKNPNGGYPEWDCNKDKFKEKTEGPCMPPRRQKLCIKKLIKLENNDSKDKLREALIKCAAVETFFAWDKYKKDKEKEKKNGDIDPDEELKKGTIPEDFKHIMLFTYGDFKDLILGNDIGDDGGKDINGKVTKILSGPPNKQTPEEWWETIKKDVWEGMVCGLSHGTSEKSKQKEVQKALANNYKYDNFQVKDSTIPIGFYLEYINMTPQFLRWFTEWTEEFCRKYTEQLNKLREKCQKCSVDSTSGKGTCNKSGEDCKQCHEQCTTYTNFIDKWKTHYTSQKEKFDREKSSKYKDVVDDDKNLAHKFLDQQLEILGLHGNCIKEESKSNKGMPQSLDYPPEEIGDKCTCENPVTTTKPGKDSTTAPDGTIGAGRSLNPSSPNHNPSHPGFTDPGSTDNRDRGGSGGTKTPQGTQSSHCKIQEYIKENDKSTEQMKNGKKFCNSKENVEWNCRANDFKTGNDGACMPPRRQKMCIKYLTQLENSDDTNKLKEELIKCASLETYLLWEKYKKDKEQENPKPDPEPQKQLEQGIIPEEFKRQMFYTFSDFKDLILDKDIGKTTSGDVQKARTKIDNIFKNGQSTPKIIPDAWWETIQEEVWNAMLCSLSYNEASKGMDDALRQKLNDKSNKNGYSDVTFDGKTTTLTTFVRRPQFLRWLTEWYDDYCHKKHIKLQEVKDKCKPPGGKDIKCDDTCDGKCKEYETFMKERKGHWEKQSKYYGEQKSGSPSDYDKENSKEYLKDKLTVTCGDQSKSGNKVEENIQLLEQTPTQSSPPSYYDADVYCGCKKYIDEDKDYGEISGKNNCCGLNSLVTYNKNFEWQNTGDNYNYLSNSSSTKEPVPQNVYVPPRRQRICFKDLDNKTNVTNKQQLREQLLKDAATEGYNLGEYYKKKKEKEDEKNEQELKKYSYDVSPCNALKYSFLDLRDIIIGTDMLEPDKTETGKNLKDIFEKNGGGQTNSGEPGKPGSKERVSWWTQNQQCVWKAMQCGYKKSRDEGQTGTPSQNDLQNCGDTNPPSDTDYPLGTSRDSGKNLQFLRWFAEWGEDFCKKHHVELGKLQEGCKDYTCGSGDDTKKQQCQDACKVYQEFIDKWKKQYDKQKIKYDELKTQDTYKKVDGVKDSTHAYEYLDKSLKKSCSNSGTPGLNSGNCSCMDKPSSTQPQNSVKNMPKSLDDVTKSDYKEKCGCADKVGPGPTPPSGGRDTVDPKQPPGPHGPQPSGGPDAVDPKKNPTDPQKPKQNPDQGTTPSPQNPSSGGSQTGPNGGSVVPGGNPGPDSGTTGPGGKKPGGQPDSSGQPGGTGGAQGGNSNQDPAGKPKTPTDQFAHLDECPHKDPSNCKNYGISRGPRCYPKKTNYDSLEKWTVLTTDKNDPNFGVQVPARRKNICFPRIPSRKLKDLTPEKFKKHLLDSAATEAKHLMEYYKDDNNLALQAMKYSFGDYGNLIKGDDMENNIDDTKNKINTAINKLQSQSTTTGGTPLASTATATKFERTNWWETNKKHVWHVMLCQYNGDDKDQHCNDYDTIDKTPQFLRWLEEWARKYCSETLTMAKETREKCKYDINYTKDSSIDNVPDEQCKMALNTYKTWYHNNYNNWKILKEKYKKNKTNEETAKGAQGSSSPTTSFYTEKDAEEYVKKKCNECICNYNVLEEEYKRITQGNNDISTLFHRAQIDTFDPIKRLFYNIFTLGGEGTKIAKTAYDVGKDIISKGSYYIVPTAVMGIGTGIGAGTKLYDKINEFINHSNGTGASQNNPSHSPLAPPQDPAVQPGAGHGQGSNGAAGKGGSGSTPQIPPPGPRGTTKSQTPVANPSHPGISPTTVSLSIVPLGIALALSSLAFLFLKKKTPTRPTDIFRVLEIPQNDDAMPTKISTNRYIPYSRYKGKTYIYVEGDEPDDYLRDISSSDVTTSSSESEYEEIDLYKPRSPKYKTLIEVVLKPTKSGDTLNSDTIYSDKPSDIPSDVPIDEEWNQLKHDFISNMLQSDNMDIPENLPGNITDTQPDIVDNTVREKPFITQILDRKLYSDDNEIIYNIDWNIPENINRTNNIIDNPKYVSPNIYGGIDLINDSLNNDQHVDIYDELLKRKENELFGTKHPKNTSSNNVAKQIYDDPILNQLHLFDKWLDRHRDMCNKWSNKEEILGKLNDEWNKENKEHLFYTSTIDDIKRINDENYNTINENTQINHEDNDKTSLEHLGSTNIPPNELTTQNNGSQTKHLRTNVSMDIHMDEKNNIPCDKDDLENFYNSFDDDENHYMNLKRIVSR
ncbi:erythrocyte membrane protein 1, PfEMP1, putative [Plasmodium sp. gorilla clade G2]|uniref:erythrocyte membrane protein 1, PfEMP1, putative n=1 Tax=Plasmodium sp. gorilla clade G2 TaxID=880535 RepID=UPI000D20C282|nr:erythrocyte membrane protein 1, PfEMP1, putative [Plasmodium sp. gorilla clade G2]SOV17052.1 erythrocyte membrane protein 1, PfEMP1, putative [Plasmodium sp. gorilla clade G2]